MLQVDVKIFHIACKREGGREGGREGLVSVISHIREGGKEGRQGTHQL